MPPRQFARMFIQLIDSRLNAPDKDILVATMATMATPMSAPVTESMPASDAMPAEPVAAVYANSNRSIERDAVSAAAVIIWIIVTIGLPIITICVTRSRQRCCNHAGRCGSRRRCQGTGRARCGGRGHWGYGKSGLRIDRLRLECARRRARNGKIRISWR